MATDMPEILQGLVDKLKERGKSEDEILRVIDAQGDVLVDKIADAIEGKARRPSKVFPVIVNYDLPLTKAVDVGEYQGVHSSITSLNFPSARLEVQMEILLLRIRPPHTSEEVLSDLDKEGLRPAELPEFLAFGAEYLEVQRQFSIIGLGSVVERQKRLPKRPLLV